jgi:hypothetical protein
MDIYNNMGFQHEYLEFSYNNKNFSYKISTKKLKGKYILLDEASRKSNVKRIFPYTQG